MDATSPLRLDRLPRSVIARVTGFSTDNADVVAKLREIGFAEGDEVELLARGWLGGAPLSVRLNRTIIALRRSEAALVHIELNSGAA